MSEETENKDKNVAEETKTAAQSAAHTDQAHQQGQQNNNERRSRRSQRGGRSERRGRRGRRDRNRDDDMLNRVVTINRVSKTHKGGKTQSFAALVVVGDGKGTVGVGYGKSHEVPAAISKGELEAKKHMFTVPHIRGTVTHPVIGHDSAGTVLLRPAAPGTGVIAGGPVRAVLECAGITDVLSKSMGSSNAINIVNATVKALKSLEDPEEVAARRGLTLEEVAPASLLRARAEGIAAEKKAREDKSKNSQKESE